MTALRYTAESFSEEKFRNCGKMVAVVMNYNKKGMIGRAVESAFDQDYPCYEILAMDDASNDGSEKEMVESVKACIAKYRDKALRVTVIVNETNLTTLGQWREAVNSSDGEWFGMFCGDDVSMPCRMRVASEIIGENADAAAVCTNFTSGLDSMEPHCDTIRAVCDAKDVKSWQRYVTISGCTAFWRRNLLAQELPSGTMDDFTLTWLAAIADSGKLVWDCTRITVRYSIGTGVTTVDRAKADCESMTPGALLRKYYAIKRRGRRFGRKVWEAIREFDDKYGKDAELTKIVRGHWLASLSEGGWIDRLVSCWKMMVVERCNDFGGFRRTLKRKVLTRFFIKLLGPFSWITAFYADYAVRRIRGR